MIMIIKKKNRIILFDKDEILKNRKTNKKYFSILSLIDGVIEMNYNNF